MAKTERPKILMLPPVAQQWHATAILFEGVKFDV